MESPFYRGLKKIKKNHYAGKSINPEMEIRELLYKNMDLDEAVCDDIYARFCGNSENLFDAALTLSDIVELFNGEYDETADPLDDEDWIYVRNLVNGCAEELDMDAEDFNRLQRDANAVSLVSLDTKYGDGEGEKDIREIDIIKDERSKNPVIEAQKRDLKSLLTKGLTRAERLIIVLYYYEEMTMKEIGATLDLSESRVSQMHSSIIARLKAQMNTRKKEFSVSRS